MKNFMFTSEEAFQIRSLLSKPDDSGFLDLRGFVVAYTIAKDGDHMRAYVIVDGSVLYNAKTGELFTGHPTFSKAVQFGDFRYFAMNGDRDAQTYWLRSEIDELHRETMFSAAWYSELCDVMGLVFWFNLRLPRKHRALLTVAIPHEHYAAWMSKQAARGRPIIDLPATLIEPPYTKNLPGSLLEDLAWSRGELTTGLMFNS